jgi:hypothetical protein
MRQPRAYPVKPSDQRSLRIFAWTTFLLLFAFSLFGQADSTATTRPLTLKPTIGLGAGMLGFYGDVGSNSATYSPLVTRVGYEIRATTPITNWLEGGLYAMHGRLGVNERGSTRNLNFESRITVGGFQFRYNFDQFLNPRRVVEPYITLGFESVEFLTKTDLVDAQGRAYNYWSDGSIRNIAEGAPNAADAVLVERDYSYESDVREVNADGFGKYLERSWAVPIGIGARMDLGGGFDLRVAATMHHTFTDFIDGVTENSLDARQGDGRNDRFLYSSVSVGYGIPMERKKKVRMTPFSSEELDLIVLNDDTDKDGVPDMRDDCPDTPEGVAVDTFGCPLDGDSDGVPDHMDDEPTSAPGAIVDMRGVTLSDDDHLRGYLNYLDSGNVNIVASRRESFGPMPPKAPPAKRVYVVKVGTQVEGISEELIQKILSLPDVRTIERGDTTFYVVGNYDAIPEALRRELELKGMGIESMVMAEENGRLIDVSAELGADRDKLRGMGAGDDNREVTIRVQLGAFRYPLSKNIFKDVPDLVVIKGDDGLTRYYTGSFTDVNPAAAHKVKMLLNGFEGAFLVAFREGKRVSMMQAGAVLTGPEDLRTLPSGSVNKSLLRYKVQVGTFVGNVPMDTMGKLIEMGDVTPVTSADAVRYYYGSFKDRRSADDARKAIQLKGFADAFVVGELNGRIISGEDADRLMSEP